ncbi:Hypothetical protein CINCED_3A004786 [Cinara cedri]|uniref:Uncharacterized protein n=1 Tax=Cinara cedri TaxID=506608 RepID=A0A5E4NAB9_9HEMI|nr:Hypothetical protein CINCED_3A004786 [Cinara cedri]
MERYRPSLTVIDECVTTGFRFSVTHDDPPFGQSEPHDVCGGNPPGDNSLAQQLQQLQQDDVIAPEKSVTCDYLSPYAFTARNSLGSTSDYTRRRRPITLKIVPRLSLPCRSTSAPTTTDADWPFTRYKFESLVVYSMLFKNGIKKVDSTPGAGAGTTIKCYT